MAENETVPDLQTVIEATRRLLTEYTGKLQHWIAECRPIFIRRVDNYLLTRAENSELQNLQERHNRIRPACSDLSRMASGLIEQSRIDFVQRTEVRLRLAEFESALLQFEQMLNVSTKLPTKDK
jgi:hypothetical protein